MKEYIDLVHNLIEKPRNELRIKALESNDENIKEVLDKYEEAYYKSCLKIEEYIDFELEKMDLKHKG